MKKLIFLFVSLLLSSLIIAQDDPTIIVLSIKGNVKYSGVTGTEDVALIPGASIPIEGDIFLDDDAKVRIIVNQKSVLLTSGRYKMEDIYNANTKKSMSFSSRFWKFVMDGMGSASDRKDLNKYHREYMQVHGGIKGFTSQDSSIILLSPSGGKVGVDSVQFSWKTKPSIPYGTLVVLNNNREEKYRAKQSGDHVWLSLSEIGLELDQNYIWKIESEKDGAVIFAETDFLLVPSSSQDLISKLEYVTEYKEGSDMEKMWMEAVMFEMEGYFYDAESRYQYLLEQDKENLLVQKSYALFLSRKNQIQKAQEYIGQ